MNLIAQSSARFGFALLRELHREQAANNIGISPLNITLALAMLAGGARGGTLRGILRALSLEQADLAALDSAVEQLLRELPQDPKISMAISNSLWVNRQVELSADFARRARSLFRAEAAALDFGAPGSPERINDWVSHSTDGLIPALVQGLDPADLLILLSAILFKGLWASPFDPQRIQPTPFLLPDGSRSERPLMFLNDELRYGAYDGFEIVRLPYGAGRVAMYVLLPAEDASLDELLDGLDDRRLELAINGTSEREGLVGLPLLTLMDDRELNGALEALGMADAFEAGADFGGLLGGAAQGLALSAARHKSILRIDEEGARMAAVTELVMTLGAPPDEPFRMVVDRPFCCAIRDDQSGALLYLGAVYNPE
ncbi:MAG TPA: serpin family protein [Roseiflexaceae bacterium]|nr:serpin family protein [Roseiflexaceae bacterium]